MVEEEDPRTLVRSAFRDARDSGKRSWQRMSAAVLKNRLLALTGKSFQEEAFGAKTFRDFVLQLDTCVRLDETTQPATVELIEDLAPPEEPKRCSAPPASTPRGHVRPDLWVAIMDYSSGRRFQWDLERKEARESDGLPGEHLLPSLTVDEFTTWRRDFASLHADHAEILDPWLEGRGSGHVLPPAIRTAWNAEVRRRVVNRLCTWFEVNDLPLPDNLLLDGAARPGVASPASDEADLSAMRRLALECIRVMNADELAELRFSPSVLVRARRRHPSL